MNTSYKFTLFYKLKIILESLHKLIRIVTKKAFFLIHGFTVFNPGLKQSFTLVILKGG